MKHYFLHNVIIIIFNMLIFMNNTHINLRIFIEMRSVVLTINAFVILTIPRFFD